VATMVASRQGLGGPSLLLAWPAHVDVRAPGMRPRLARRASIQLPLRPIW
jgi:hypothetical protein